MTAPVEDIWEKLPRLREKARVSRERLTKALEQLHDDEDDGRPLAPVIALFKDKTA